jgi:hypothetical protein
MREKPSKWPNLPPVVYPRVVLRWPKRVLRRLALVQVVPRTRRRRPPRCYFLSSSATSPCSPSLVRLSCPQIGHSVDHHREAARIALRRRWLSRIRRQASRVLPPMLPRTSRAGGPVGHPRAIGAVDFVRSCISSGGSATRQIDDTGNPRTNNRSLADSEHGQPRGDHKRRTPRRPRRDHPSRN